ncbi:hypothetical protein BGZ98_009630 [Dissophora globulifera]|nr:hypothetical protein BGZ98_009630 [Dissophora globulifera]
MAPKSKAHIDSDIELSDDEGVPKNLDYKPPKDFTLSKSKKNVVSAFDVDETVNHELWLIRVPEGVTNEDLATMSLALPQESPSTKETLTIGTLKKKEISSKSTSSSITKYQLQTVSPDSGFAGEMLALQALIPDSSQHGRLVQAPLGIHRHLALVAHPSLPSGTPLAEEILARPIPKREQPEGLKMRFKVSGFDTQVPGSSLSGSGKKFAARWAETLEKRQRDLEEDMRREQQAMENALKAEADEQAQEEEEEDAEVAQAVESGDDIEEAAVVKTVETVELETEIEPPSAKKRKAEEVEVAASEEKKIKKEKKDKKEKKEKKERKEKKEKKSKDE